MAGLDIICCIACCIAGLFIIPARALRSMPPIPIPAPAPGAPPPAPGVPGCPAPTPGIPNAPMNGLLAVAAPLPSPPAAPPPPPALAQGLGRGSVLGSGVSGVVGPALWASVASPPVPALPDRGAWTSVYMRRRKSKPRPDGWFSMLLIARSMFRVISRWRLGLRAASMNWRSCWGSFKMEFIACATSGFDSMTRCRSGLAIMA
mmetsp:Transcript_33763/g.95025  ORF Transcript_33763/g.95025 Transcript_33763/m.95025 type:complete len:204 (-) Transcript_33763:586-1197(-)